MGLRSGTIVANAQDMVYAIIIISHAITLIAGYYLYPEIRGYKRERAASRAALSKEIETNTSTSVATLVLTGADLAPIQSPIQPVVRYRLINLNAMD